MMKLTVFAGLGCETTVERFMPPKGKRGGKGGKAGKAGANAAGAAGAESAEERARAKQERIEAQEEEVRLKVRALETERSARNYAQMERDKVAELYDAAKKKLEKQTAECLAMDARVEELERRHQADIKVYSQKIKALRYEFTLTEKEVGEWSEDMLDKEGRMHQDRCQRNKADQFQSHRVMKDQTLREERHVMKLRKQNQSELSIMKKEFFERLKKMEREYQTQEKKATELLDFRRRAEIMQMEQEKNKHINTIIHNHEEAFENTRQYHNEVLANNLEIVAQFEQELHEMRQRNSEKNDMILEIGKENLKLKPPLQRAMEEKTVLLDCLKNEEKNRESMARVQGALAKTERSMNELRLQMDELERKLEQVSKERDEIQGKMLDMELEEKHEVALKNKRLEERVEALKKRVVSKEAQIEEVVRQFRIQPEVLEHVGRRMDEELDTRDHARKSLEEEILRVRKAHMDSVRVLRQRLLEEGVPERELPEGDREMLENPQPHQATGLLCNPAGLVVG